MSDVGDAQHLEHSCSDAEPVENDVQVFGFFS